jgi:hypothetical protein
MPPNFGGGFQHAATNTGKGEHPDLRDDTILTPEQRRDQEWDHQYADPTYRGRFDKQLKERMRRWPSDVLLVLDGVTFAGTPSEGYRQFEAERRRLGRETNTIFESDIAGMSADDYDRCIEAANLPRRGYRLVLDKGETAGDAASGRVQGRVHYVIDRRHEGVPPADDR